MKALWLIVFLVACAAPTPTEYRRGVLAPPPAPVRPGVGAPVVGQPGRAPAMPRSPYTRVLPQTPETMRQPGIWASDAPDDADPTVLGVSVPIPPSAKGDLQALLFSNACATAMQAEAVSTGVDVAAQALPPDVRRCLAMRIQHYCLFWRSKKVAPDRAPTAKAVADYVAKMRDMACRGIPREAHEPLFNRSITPWSRRNVPNDAGSL